MSKQKYYFFIDETGDHSLKNIDENFPYFLLCWILISESDYKQLELQIVSFKQSFLWNSDVILHSRDIRKHEKWFQVLFDLSLKEKFYKQLNEILGNTSMIIISACIKKEQYVKKYWRTAHNPYEVCLSYLLERLVFATDWISDVESVEILVEKRGKKEDSELLNHYNRVYSSWTFYVEWARFAQRISKFDFRNKYKNDIGIQIADLCAYPLVSYIRYPVRTNLAYDIISSKIYQNNWKKYWIKIFP